jgi:hypothetical protein
MEQTLLDGKKIICCFDSKKEMENIVQRLKGFCENNKLDKQLKNFLVYSSEEGDESDFLCINDKWKSKNIFYTPKITIGVSFDNKIPRKVFLIAQGTSINSFGFVQQISRCRNISELHYYVVDRFQPIKYESDTETRNHYSGLLEKFELHYTETLSIDSDSFNIWVPECIKLKTLYDNHCIGTDYKTGTRFFNGDIYNDLFFIHEYHDNIIRSAPRLQFRWILESRGYTIKHNNEQSEEADIEINISNRVLYSNYQSLTDPEKKIYDNARKYAKFIGIDFDSKVAKKKCENVLLSDKVFMQHFAYRMLMGDVPSKKQMKKQYDISVSNNLYQKIELIKQLEGVLDIKTLEIDTKVDVERFDEEIEVDDEMKDSINKVFRVEKNPDENELELFRYWYYQLIQMYRNILGNDMFDYVERRINYDHYYSYSINDEIYRHHKTLL